MNKEQLRREIIAELLSSGGVTYDRAAKEVLYYLPDNFVKVYTDAFHKAFSDTDGGVGGRGKSTETKGQEGRATGRPGGMPRLSKEEGLRRKEEWKKAAKERGEEVGEGTKRKNTGEGMVRNTAKSNKGAKQDAMKKKFGYNGALGEAIAGVKDKADKRLRTIARDMVREIEELEARHRGGTLGNSKNGNERDGKDGGSGRVSTRCGGCGGFTGDGWFYCARCGYKLVRRNEGKE